MCVVDSGSHLMWDPLHLDSPHPLSLISNLPQPSSLAFQPFFLTLMEYMLLEHLVYTVDCLLKIDFFLLYICLQEVSLLFVN